jgi:hypothetical protein
VARSMCAFWLPVNVLTCTRVVGSALPLRNKVRSKVCRGILTTVGERCRTVMDVLRNGVAPWWTCSGTVSHRGGRAPERYRTDEVCGTRFVASYDGGCKCQHVKS